jgi:hypothetical protein
MSYAYVTILFLNGKPVPSAIDQSHLKEPWENYGGDNNIGYSEKREHLQREKKNAKVLWNSLRIRIYYLLHHGW